jgi:hypothetical protein
MKERGIIMRDWEVRAIQEGRKTMKRFVVKWPLRSRFDGCKSRLYFERDIPEMNERLSTWTRHPLFQFCPFGQVGERLWVRETWAPHADMPGSAIYRCDRGGDYQDTVTPNFRWRPSIHMPRWACRLVLEIVSVRVERLQDITEEDAEKEGVEHNGATDGSWSDSDGWIDYVDLASGGEGFPATTARESFQSLWDSIYGNWNLNPYVWVVEFRKVEDNR